MKTLISVEMLQSLLHYDPETGILTWKFRQRELFKTQRSFSTWNARYADKAAFTKKMPNGYLRGSIFGKEYYAHRVILAMVNGKWPNKTDHELGDREDNRQAKLRDVSVIENNRNLKLRCNNTSGVPGVVWCKRTGKWHSRIGVDQRNISLGYHIEFSDAIAARKSAEAKYGFHPNHGRPQ